MRPHLIPSLAAFCLALPGFAAAAPTDFDFKADQPPPICATSTVRDSIQVAQLACCKKNKGVCGCRAGKIVCCDNAPSNEPGCTCHGDEAIVE